MAKGVYGFAQMPIEEARRKIESLLDLTFEARHSYDRCGDYYIFEDRKNDLQIVLQENCEEDPGEWTEDKHRDMHVILYYIADSETAAQAHEVLMNGLKNVALLRRSTL